VEDFFYHPSWAALRARVDLLVVEADPGLLAAMATHHRLSSSSASSSSSSSPCSSSTPPPAPRFPSVMERLVIHAIGQGLHVVLAAGLLGLLSLEEWRPLVEAVMEAGRASSPGEGRREAGTREREANGDGPSIAVPRGDEKEREEREEKASRLPLSPLSWRSWLLPPLSASPSPSPVLFGTASVGQWRAPHMAVEWPNRIGAPFRSSSPPPSASKATRPPPSTYPSSVVSAIGTLQRLQLVLTVPAPARTERKWYRRRGQPDRREENRFLVARAGDGAPSSSSLSSSFSLWSTTEAPLAPPSTPGSTTAKEGEGEGEGKAAATVRSDWRAWIVEGKREGVVEAADAKGTPRGPPPQRPAGEEEEERRNDATGAAAHEGAHEAEETALRVYEARMEREVQDEWGRVLQARRDQSTAVSNGCSSAREILGNAAYFTVLPDIYIHMYIFLTEFAMRNTIGSLIFTLFIKIVYGFVMIMVSF